MNKRAIVWAVLITVMQIVPMSAWAAGTISGTVTAQATGNPISGVNIRLLDSVGSLVKTTTTDASGLYSLASITAGSGYEVQARNGLNYVSQDVFGVTVADGNVTTLDFVMLPGGQITGTVTDNATGLPISNIQVLIFDSAWLQYRSGLTNASGVYSVGGLPVRSDYRVAAVGNAAYGGQWQSPITVTPGTPFTVNFSLVQGGSVSGTVTDGSTGMPLSGITVSPFCDAAAFNGWPCGNPAVTDMNGQYTIIGLTPVVTTYTIQTSATASYAGMGQSGVSVSAGNTTTVDFAVYPNTTGTISGTVTASGSGDPVAYLQVNVFDSNFQWISGTQTDETGFYSIPGLPERNDYQVQVQGDANHAGDTQSGISVTGGNTTSVNFSLQPGGSISGTVTASGTNAPISGLQVAVCFNNQCMGGGWTDQGGSYTVVGVPVRSDLQVQVQGNQTYAGQSQYNISVTAGYTTTVNFSLDLAGRISGTVTASDTHLPIANLQVNVMDINGQWYGGSMTDGSGSYTVFGLPARTDYQMVVQGNVTYAGQNRTGITVTAGNLTAENFSLVLGGNISGTVRDAVTGLGISGIFVMAIDANNGPWTQLGFTNTDANGNYQLLGIPGGSHKVVTMQGNGSWYVQQFYSGAATQDSARPVTVTVGEFTAGIDFSLNKGGALSGVVTDGSGNPLANVEVDALYPNGNEVAWSKTDASGAYTLGPVGPGVIVRALLPGTNYVSRYYGGSLYRVSATLPTVTAETVTPDVNISLSQGGMLTGIMTVDGAAPSEGWINVYSVTDNKWMFDSSVEGGIIDPATGTWWIAVPAGTYKIIGSARTGAGETAPMYYGGTHDFDAASTVTITGTETLTDLNMALSSQKGTVSGSISYSGSKTGQVIYWMSPNSGKDWPNVATVSGIPAPGAYSVDVAPGTWYVKAFVDVNGNTQYDAGEPFGEYAGGSVTVTNGNTVSGVDIVVADGGAPAPTNSPITWYNTGSGQSYVQTMTGSMVTGGSMIWAEPNTAWSIVGRGDFNGDGVGDYVWWNSSTGDVYIMLMSSATVVNRGAIVWTEPDVTNWRIVTTGDLNGDGTTDLIWRNSATGQIYGMLINNGTVASAGYMWTESNLAWKLIAANDINGDGKADLIWWNNSTGQVYGMLMNGLATGSMGIIWTEPAVSTWLIAGVGDLNGDGKADLVWRNRTTGDVYVMLLNGLSIASMGPVYAEPNPDWEIVSVNDYSADGKADLLWRNKTTGQVYLVTMNGLSATGGGMLYTEPSSAWRIEGPTEWLSNVYGVGAVTP